MLRRWFCALAAMKSSHQISPMQRHRISKARDIDFDTELRRAQDINPITTTHRDHINVANGNPGGLEMKYRVPLNPCA